MITFSLSERLYSMITGELFSSIPSVSIRPPCVFPVEYSDARNRTPRNTSRWRSINDWRLFSSPTDEPLSSYTVPAPMRNSLMSLIDQLLRLQLDTDALEGLG